jgi:hypothetical protein
LVYENFPVLISFAAWLAALAVKAIYVREGLTQLAEVINAPSVT